MIDMIRRQRSDASSSGGGAASRTPFDSFGICSWTRYDTSRRGVGGSALLIVGRSALVMGGRR